MKLLQRRWVAELINWTVILGLVLPIGLLYKMGDELVRNGFYCNDESLGYPLRESTVPNTILTVSVLLLPTVIVAAVELLLPGGGSLQAKFLSCYWLVTVYLLGGIVTFLFTAIGKLTWGRLRPNFFAVCQPNFNDIKCEDKGRPLYVTDYECDGEEDREAWRSFPSGHASIACQAATFVILYLQARLAPLERNGHRTFIVLFIQAVAASLAAFTSLSRVTDYKHHPSDVAAGALLGIVVQSANCFLVTGLFDKAEPEHEEKVGNAISIASISGSVATNISTEEDFSQGHKHAQANISNTPAGP